jgi:hypothetical protein
MTSASRATAQRGGPGGSRARRWRNASVAVAAVALALSGWLLVRGSDDQDTPLDGPGADLGVAHVHGLGINPADGALYVATHNGTFRIPDDGAAQRVGDSFQDTMGFTVAGPDLFLGSGHPDVAGMREGQPPLLGLIESTDAGESWRSLSLSGEVDFHGLAYAHDQVYGWDSTSGRFMVSTDRRAWDTRATLDLYGFVVDPGDRDRIVAAAPGGLRTSVDGGRTWSNPAGPEAVTITAAPDGTVWTAEQGGTVQRSDDGGDTWTEAGSLPGEPQALLATGDALWAAAHSTDGATGIYRSTDEGRAWELRYVDPAA